MMGIAAQVSLYPLRQDHLSPAIGEVVRTFQEHGLEARTGPMSTLVWGDDEEIFAALKEGFRRAAVRGETVMVVTLSNACPLPVE